MAIRIAANRKRRFETSINILKTTPTPYKKGSHGIKKAGGSYAIFLAYAIFFGVCHIFCRNHLIFTDFYAIQTPIVWHILGAFLWQYGGWGWSELFSLSWNYYQYWFLPLLRPNAAAPAMVKKWVSHFSNCCEQKMDANPGTFSHAPSLKPPQNLPFLRSCGAGTEPGGQTYFRDVSGKSRVLVFFWVWSFNMHAPYILSADDLGHFSGIL